MADSPPGESKAESPSAEPTREERLAAALDRGVTELPENQPKGWLGERSPDFRKVDDFAPDLNAGISQEIDTPVVWTAVVLGYLLGFVPGFVVLWASKRFTLRQKVVVSVVGVLFVAILAVELYLHR